MFAPPGDSPADYPVLLYPHCSSDLVVSVQPDHPHHLSYGGRAVPVDRAENADVLWGWGSKFRVVTPIRGFTDATDPFSYEYLYFIGSGEVRYWVNLEPSSDEPLATGQLYMARVRASESAIAAGAFEYFAGFDTHTARTRWGNYDRAVPLMPRYVDLAFSLGRVTSIAKHDGVYYMAVTTTADWTGRAALHGMKVLTSRYGFTWHDAGFVEYSDIDEDCNPRSPGYNCFSEPYVYGHAWVPAALYSDPERPDRMAYLFSVWNRYWGYFYDHWFTGAPAQAIEEGARFRDYNTKMYWYNVVP